MAAKTTEKAEKQEPKVPKKPKKRKPKKATKQERLELLSAAINKELGGHAVIMPAQDVPNVHILRRPFGIPSMDMRIGGGLPASGISTISGPPGVGKSLLCWQAAAQVQKNYGDNAAILYATNEGALAKDLARMGGCAAACSPGEIDEIQATRALRGLRPLGKAELEGLEASVGILQQAVADSAEALLDLILMSVRSGEYQLVVVDSITNMLPESVRDSEMGGGKVSDRAGLVTQFVTKLTHAFLTPTPMGGVNESSLLAVKQMRSNMNRRSMRSPETKESLVANALDHNRLVGLQLDQEGDHFGTGSGWHKKRDGKVVKWKVIKGKAGCHEGHSGSYNFHFDAGVDVVGDVVYSAIMMGVIVKEGSWFYIVDEEGEIVSKHQGKDKLRSAVAQDPGLGDDLVASTMRAAEIVYRTT